MQYTEFLESKQILATNAGFEVDEAKLNPSLFPFQCHAVSWALAKGKSALFLDTGLGKAICALEWARQIYHQLGTAKILFLTPLAVAQQLKAEASKFNIDVPVTIAKEAGDIQLGINISNYERLDKFDSLKFDVIVLDESSILKSFSGTVRTALIQFASTIPYRLACTATPAPNDLMEIANHAEFLGVMRLKEIQATFFVQDGNTTRNWRLKSHAENDFWRWISSWAIVAQKPSDLGKYSDESYNLPPLNVRHIILESEVESVEDNGQLSLLPVAAKGLNAQRKARKDSLEARVQKCAELVNASDEPWVIWCDLNSESEMLYKLIEDAVEIRGSTHPDKKESYLIGFSEGESRVLVTKPSIAGFGLNWQHCRNMVFVGLSNSWEQYYQAIRRCYRFGQHKEVNVFLLLSDRETSVLQNIQRKEDQSKELFKRVTQQVNRFGQHRMQSIKEEMEYKTSVTSSKTWEVRLGDSCELIKNVPDDTIDLTVTSIPFASMYAYTSSMRDVGNSTSQRQLLRHLKFLMQDLLRATKPGRNCAIHLAQEPMFKHSAGQVGFYDFRGAVIRMMSSAGWVPYRECTIDKNPQLKAQRTKDMTLLFKTLSTDSANSGMAFADYLVIFKKPGENLEPIQAGSSPKYNNGAGWITNDEWIRWARPVWYGADWTPEGETGIRETDVLSAQKDEADEKHLCALQLGVIERSVKLWSNPGELVFDPFSGIGSTGYKAIELNRKYLGFEIKESYYQQSIRRLTIQERKIESKSEQLSLFDSDLSVFDYDKPMQPSLFPFEVEMSLYPPEPELDPDSDEF